MQDKCEKIEFNFGLFSLKNIPLHIAILSELWNCDFKIYFSRGSFLPHRMRRCHLVPNTATPKLPTNLPKRSNYLK